MSEEPEESVVGGAPHASAVPTPVVGQPSYPANLDVILDIDLPLAVRDARSMKSLFCPA